MNCSVADFIGYSIFLEIFLEMRFYDVSEVPEKSVFTRLFRAFATAMLANFQDRLVMSCCGARNFLLALAHKISTAATPYASLLLPLAALGNVPTSICLRISNIIYDLDIIPQFYQVVNSFFRKLVQNIFLFCQNAPVIKKILFSY